MSRIFKLFLPGFIAISCLIAAVIIIALFVVAPFYEEKKDVNKEMMDKHNFEISTKQPEQGDDSI